MHRVTAPLAWLLACAAAFATRPTAEDLQRLRRGEWHDIVVYGGTAAGVMAAVQARAMGRSVVVLEASNHVGGLTTGGLGATDTGNIASIGGLAREFYRRVHQHYLDTYGPDSQQVKDCHNGFRFEPHVASLVLQGFLDEAGVRVRTGQRLARVRMREGRILWLETQTGARHYGAMYIDATYEGDLMAAAGVGYTVGREGNRPYYETLNGVQLGRPYHNFLRPVDPYLSPGDPASGLVWGVTPDPPGENGDGDRRVQAYNFRMCLTRNPANRLPFPKPPDYDPSRYELLARYLATGVWDALRGSTPLPNGKTDTNNNGGFSTDNIGRNHDWPEADPATRERIFADHVSYQQGLLWFLCHDERVPPPIREEVSQWGLAADEFAATGGWPPQLYVREARRMVADYVMTEYNCRGLQTARDSVGMASYGMDSHHVRRIVIDGQARNEGDVQVGGFPPYPVSYRSIVPRRGECGNLLVPICLSASHIAYGSIRMEPVFMILAQSAATAAALAIGARCDVQDLPYSRLRERLLAAGQVLERAQMVRPGAPPPAPLAGVVVDDEEGIKSGDWIASLMPEYRRVGVGYIHDGNTNKGGVSIVYTPNVPRAGRYVIVLLSPPHPNRATNVPVTIAIESREPVTVLVDQRDPSQDGFAALGVFDLPAGRSVTVTVSNRDTNGYVVADGLQLVAVYGSR